MPSKYEESINLNSKMIALLLVAVSALTRVYDPHRLEQLIEKSSNLE